MSHRQQKSHGEPSSIHPAVRWFFRLRGPESPALGPEELQAWESFAAAPANREELVEIEELWQTVRTLGGPRMPTDAELEADDFDDSLSVRQWMARRAAEEGRSRTTYFGRSPELLWLAASVATAAIGVALYSQSWLTSHALEQTRTFATPIAQQRAVKLADGSVVTLGARTGIHTRMTATERVIVLDRGEAWFKVAHERRRPFKVIAGDGVITAIGTEFNVRRDLDTGVDRVTVTVGAGAVKVEPRDIADRSSPSLGGVNARRQRWEIAKLEKGHELTYDSGGERSAVKRADIEAAAAWKEGRLEYIHQPLKAVVAGVNRYSRKPIVLAEDSIGDIDFSGTVFESQIDEWLRALQSAFPIEVTESDDRILIRSRNPD